MARHQTHAINVVIEGTLAPAFIPLMDIKAETRLLASQSTLTVEDTPSPLEVALMLCQPGTVLGDPADKVLYASDLTTVEVGEPFVLPGSIGAIDVACVLGLFVPVQALPSGASVTCILSTVR